MAISISGKTPALRWPSLWSSHYVNWGIL